MNIGFQPQTGVVTDDTIFAAPGRWRDMVNTRFYGGNWQTIGGWESLTLDLLGGVCRAVIGWTAADFAQDFAFGTHQTLEAWDGGVLGNITPGPPGATVVLDLAHSVVDPILTTAADSKVRVVEINHGRVNGATVRMAGFTAVGGLDVNGDWVIVAGPLSDVNNFYIQHTDPATSTAAGGGATGTVQATPFIGFTPGAIDGAGGPGYGAGLYGMGLYGLASPGDFFPLTWSLAIWGNELRANPRGQTIFKWDGVLANPATPLANAPEQVSYMVVTPSRQVMAIGCNEETSGLFNPLCIRWSDIEDDEVWNTAADNNAGEYIVEGGGRLVAARVVGDYVFVWSNMAVYLGTFVGSPGITWSFEKVAEHCGLVGPGGVAIKGQTAAWISPDYVFWSLSLGGSPTTMDCPVRLEFSENVALGQDDKIVATTISSYNEVVWYYPDARDGLENSRSITVSPQGWAKNQIRRTAACDAGPAPYPVKVTPEGNVYWHEKGSSADGAPLVGYIEGTDFYLQEADAGYMINGFWPDFRNQVGAINLTIFGREFPQDTERTHGPYQLGAGVRKRSFRMSARIARVRFDFNSSPAYVRAGRGEFDIAPIGGR